MSAFLVTIAYPALAALGLEEAGKVATDQGLFQGTLSGIIREVILWLMSLSTVIALAALIWAGFLYISAFTNEKNVEQAKKIAFYAILGLILMGGAFLIINVVRKILL